MFLDAAVKLASAGAFGVCIYAILWCGTILKDVPEDAKNRQNLLRQYMLLCLAIAGIAAFTGLAPLFFDTKHQAELDGIKLRDQAESDGNKLRDLQNHIKDLVQEGNFSALIEAKTSNLNSLEDGPLKEKLKSIDEDLRAMIKVKEQTAK